MGDLDLCAECDTDPFLVAAKVLKGDASQQDLPSFFCEAMTVGQFTHPNIVWLFNYGVCVCVCVGGGGAVNAVLHVCVHMCVCACLCIYEWVCDLGEYFAMKILLHCRL